MWIVPTNSELAPGVRFVTAIHLSKEEWTRTRDLATWQPNAMKLFSYLFSSLADSGISAVVLLLPMALLFISEAIF